MEPGDIYDHKLQIIECLGQGGMGVVYKVMHLTLEELFALKVVRAEIISDPAAAKRLKNEAQLASQLVHDNIVRVISSGMCDGTPYILMEYLTGKSLAEKLAERSPLSIEELFPIVEQCCRALSHAHARGIAHLDLKPGNIWLQDSNVKLLDFGIAKAIDEGQDSQKLASTGTLVGSPAYMSPEQCKGKAPSSASDTYSLGCVIYECLTGETPFTGEVMSAVLLKHLNDAPKRPSKHAASLKPFDEIVLGMLSKDPKQRPRLDEVVLALDPDTDRIRLHRQRQKLEQMAKARRVNLALLILACIFVPIGGAYLFMQTNSSIPVWEELMRSSLAQNSRATKQQIAESLARQYHSAGRTDQEAAIYLSELREALESPGLVFEMAHVRELALKLCNLAPGDSSDEQWTTDLLSRARKISSKRRDEAADLIEIAITSRYNRHGKLTIEDQIVALGGFQLRTKKGEVGDYQRQYVDMLTAAIRKNTNRKLAATTNARFILELIAMNDHAKANTGLSPADMSARICDALQRLSKVQQDPKTTEQMEKLFLSLSLFAHDPPSNWKTVTADLYKNKTVTAILLESAGQSDAARTRTYYYWLNGEMALAAGDRSTAKIYFQRAKTEYAGEGRSLANLGHDAALIRQSLENRLKLTSTTSP